MFRFDPLATGDFVWVFLQGSPKSDDVVFCKKRGWVEGRSPPPFAIIVVCLS